MSFFKNVGKALGNVGKAVGNVVKTVAPIAAIVPGIGPIVAGAAGVVGELLSPTKQEAIVQAVERDQVVKVDKIEETIAKSNPTVDAASLQVAVNGMVQQAIAANPTASIDDSKSLTNVGTFTKIFQWIKANAVLVLGAVGGILYFMSNKKGGSRRYRRY